MDDYIETAIEEAISMWPTNEDQAHLWAHRVLTRLMSNLPNNAEIALRDRLDSVFSEIWLRHSTQADEPDNEDASSSSEAHNKPPSPPDQTRIASIAADAMHTTTDGSLERYESRCDLARRLLEEEIVGLDAEASNIARKLLETELEAHRGQMIFKKI